MNEIPEITALLKKGEKMVAMVAPSFVVDFDYMTFADTLRLIGFDKATELTFGAKEVNEFYMQYLHEHKKLCINTTCPAIVEIVMQKFPHLVDNLVPCASPMLAMAKIVKRQYPNHKRVFIGPCIAKKEEAKKYPEEIDFALTFREAGQLIEACKKTGIAKKLEHKNYLFDQFYNDATKIYPLAGGMGESMHVKEILKKDEFFACDGPCATKVLEHFDKHPGHLRFLDIVLCRGGCIGGPGIISKEPIEKKKKKVLDYMAFARKHRTGERVGLDKYVKGISFSVKFSKHKVFKSESL